MNTHIDGFLDYYSELQSPQYAVLIKGKWGSGKTHYINEFKKRLDTNSKKYIYVSLYGVTNYDEIETKFLETLHPKLYNKKTVLLGKIAKGFLKGALKVDLDDDGKADGTVSGQVPDIDPKDLLNTQNHILIFDDLERCSISVNDILGYINYFVEHQDYKVIIIANEKELEKDNKYKNIKEKLVGKTFDLIPNSDLAFQNFLKQVSYCKTILSDNKTVITKIFEKANYNNLRHLRQTILDFDLFFKKINPSYIDNDKLIEEIIELFFIISIEIKNDNSMINKIFNIYNEKSILRDKYEINYYNLILPLDFLKQVFIGEKIDSEKLNYYLSVSKYYINETQDDWIKLWNYLELSDEKLQETIDNSLKKLKEKEYTDIYIIIHIFAILLSLSKTGLYSENKKAILKNAKKTVENNVDSFENIDFELDVYSGQYGKGFFGEDTQEFKELILVIDKHIQKSKKEYIKNKSKEILEELKNGNIEEIINTFKNNHHIQKEPIFKNINHKELFEIVSKLKNKDLREFHIAIINRYKFIDETFIDEESFWEKYKKTVLSKTNKSDKTISTHLLLDFVKHIDKILKRISQEKNRLILIKQNQQ